MKDLVYKLVEVTGASAMSIEDAMEKAINRSRKTIMHLCWFQIMDTRGSIEKGRFITGR